MKKVIIAVSVLTVIGVSAYFMQKPKISIESADWLNKKVEYQVSAGFKKATGIIKSGDKNQTGELGFGYSYVASFEGGNIVIAIFWNNKKDNIGVIVDLKNQKISNPKKLIGS